MKFQPGQSGNPAGRPPGARNKTTIAREQELAERALYGVCQGILPAQRIFSPSSVSLFDLKARFFVPTRPSLTAARAGAVKVGRRTNLSACSALARPCLDGLEHDGTLTRSGRRSEGSLPSGADHRAAT